MSSSSSEPSGIKDDVPKDKDYRTPGFRGVKTTSLFRAVNPELFIKPVRHSLDYGSDTFFRGTGCSLSHPVFPTLSDRDSSVVSPTSHPLGPAGQDFVPCHPFGEFDNTTSTHWENPGKHFPSRKRLDVLYPFHSDLVSKWSESPKVDPPVSRLSSQTVLSIPDAASLKYPTDRQIEALAKSAFEASGASFCPSFTSSWVAKAVSAWAKTLRRGILASAPAEGLSDLADQISLAGKYRMNASLDAACLARANSNIVAIRRVLWLKVWNTDPASKKSLTGLPFQGSRLFGTQLDQMISDATGGRRFLLSCPPKQPSHLPGLLRVVNSLLASGVVVPVPYRERFSGFYSNLFVVPKKDGSLRPILDLKRLNHHLRIRHFRIESLCSVVVSMEPGEFLCSVDIRDAYLHVPICVQHQRFLRFAIQEHHYQFTALPFGLASAPRVFTKVMAAVMAILRSKGILRLEFLGMEFDTSQAQVFLPKEKFLSLRRGVRALKGLNPLSLCLAMRVLGKMVASMEAVPYAQFHSRPLQLALLTAWDRNPLSLNRPFRLSPRVDTLLVDTVHLHSAREVISPSPLASYHHRRQPPGLGSVFSPPHGCLTAQEACLPINLLEIRAIFLALNPLGVSPLRKTGPHSVGQSQSRGLHKPSGRDSQQTSHDGSGKNSSLGGEPRSLSFSRSHPRGGQLGSRLSKCQGIMAGEWSLLPSIFSQICQRWGVPDIDLMASWSNHKVYQYVSRSRDPMAVGCDALVISWAQFQIPYLFPPLPLIPRVIRKIKSEGVPVLLVALLVVITSIRRVSEPAASSCRSPFLILHKDKVVLRPVPSFLPKVVSAFHINEDIVLPSLCPSPVHPLEKSLHKLNVVRAIFPELLPFVRPILCSSSWKGVEKGLPASKSTIARWICSAVLEAYRVHDKRHPLGVRAHSTQAVGASWAVRHQASASQVCKAVTWSSIHTFVKFYKCQPPSDSSIYPWLPVSPKEGSKKEILRFTTLGIFLSHFPVHCMNKPVMAFGLFSITACVAYIAYLHATEENKREVYEAVDSEGNRYTRRKASKQMKDLIKENKIYSKLLIY
ncbi:unnamed protein product [Ranitomeya imitator]|uniref:ribonuclease H n=1 Tax=Ranitomeya imitator TaxID=111125 RepID=A0ABN9MCS3_9NEOB|nr:unnamed protein product [Ranitomeya imitator]